MVTIEPPPAPQKLSEQPLFMLIGPSLSMAIPMLAGSVMAIFEASGNGIYMYTGLITAILSAAIGAIWAVVNVRYNRGQAKKQETHRFSAYSAYLVRITEEIRSKYEQNSQAMKKNYPAAQACLSDGC